MFDRSLFKEFPLQLITFFGLIYLGSHLSSFLLKYLDQVYPVLELSSSSGGMKISQIITSSILFIVPTFVCGWLFSMDDTKRYLHLDRPYNWKLTWVSILAIILAQPLINLLATLNGMITFPSFMAHQETLLRSMEQAMELKMNTMLSSNHFGDLMVNLLVVALFAGVVEELFFRGLLQRIAYTAVENKHIAVWVTAVIFSVVHFQFFGFIPRLLLGAFFGYLVYATGSVWCSAIVHAVNNAFVVVVKYIEQNNSDIHVSHWGAGNQWWIGVVSLIMLFFLVRFFNKKKCIEL